MQIELDHQGAQSSTFVRLERFGDLVPRILNGALDAFARVSVEDAQSTIELDRKVNAEFDSLMREPISQMMEDPRTIKSALRVSWGAPAMERTGDHARNICEYVMYLVLGKDVRHIDTSDRLDP